MTFVDVFVFSMEEKVERVKQHDQIIYLPTLTHVMLSGKQDKHDMYTMWLPLVYNSLINPSMTMRLYTGND